MNLDKYIFFALIILNLISDINCNYLKMTDEMEAPLKRYLLYSFSGKLLPQRKFVRSQNPKISVIIPMYNEEKNALKVIRTIQNQKLQDIEIVCVNDNSNDKTLEILEKKKIADELYLKRQRTKNNIMKKEMENSLKSCKNISNNSNV